MRMINTLFSKPMVGDGLQSSTLALPIRKFSTQCREHPALVKALPQEFQDQVSQSIWLGFSRQSAFFHNSLDLIRVIQPEPDHTEDGAAISALNERLEEALDSSPAAEKETQLRMLVAYISEWLFCHSLTRANRADTSQWPDGPTDSFIKLSHAVLELEGNYPSLQQELGKDIDAIRTWAR
ncbi:hypothetical protein NMY22_g13295 [Coprinellus aureogranulatus]|nr:hypothetical protein NMY22_g13295 [Coprinellus aureogranulatus]